ncbi:MAG: type II toxin-antitoxin system RelE/ParE family toxin [Candidatus Omnitrophota bacterium]
MNIKFFPLALKELEDAVSFYNDQFKDLGNQFYHEVFEAIGLIRKYPAAWQKVGNNTSRYILRRFPYLILYVFEDDFILITAIAHQHRNPDYYLNRKNIN